MSVKRISDAVAFNPGATVWLLSDPKSSTWSKRLDWYLNFQMVRALHHSPPVVPAGLREILSELHLAEPDIIHDPKAPILLTGHNRAPARKIICLPMEDSIVAWQERLQEILAQLTANDLVRVFLPRTLAAETLTRSLIGGPATVEIVQDPDTNLGGQ